jgi:hypothetical protein
VPIAPNGTADHNEVSSAIPVRVVPVTWDGESLATGVTIADNGDFAQGSVTDAVWIGTGNATVIAALKRLAGARTVRAENDTVTPFNTIYYGEATPGTASSSAGWAIRKFVYDVNNTMTAMQWADGTAAFVKIWDDRANYTYS